MRSSAAARPEAGADSQVEKMIDAFVRCGIRAKSDRTRLVVPPENMLSSWFPTQAALGWGTLVSCGRGKFQSNPSLGPG
jgi:hypothetical protein